MNHESDLAYRRVQVRDDLKRLEGGEGVLRLLGSAPLIVGALVIGWMVARPWQDAGFPFLGGVAVASLTAALLSIPVRRALRRATLRRELARLEPRVLESAERG